MSVDLFDDGDLTADEKLLRRVVHDDIMETELERVGNRTVIVGGRKPATAKVAEYRDATLGGIVDAIGEERAAEIVCGLFDRFLGVPKPSLTETEAIARWGVLLNTYAAKDIDAKDDHFWESIAYGFFLALGFNPYVALRLARQVDR